VLLSCDMHGSGCLNNNCLSSDYELTFSPVAPRVRVSRYRQEALGLARGSNAQKATLNHLEFTVETQAKELGTLQKEHMRLREGMVDAWKEKAELVQRWMEEKKEEAARVNKYNDAQERYNLLPLLTCVCRHGTLIVHDSLLVQYFIGKHLLD